MRSGRWLLPVGIVLTLILAEGVIFSQTRAQLNTGKEVFEASCVACHNHDGRGTPQAITGFEPPATFPDFTACRATAREADEFWSAIIHNGGPARGFSPIMPSFREALTDEQIDKVIEYMRGFCTEPSWPAGELNLPKALFTEKAFPEDEWVWQSSVDATGDPAVGSSFVFEKRFGARNQIEVKAPFSFAHPSMESWRGGVGDMALGYKRVLVSSKRTGSIVSFLGETIFPTGNAARGFGKGTTVFEATGTYGQLLPKNSFVQFHSGVELPTHREDAPRAVFWRTTVGKTLAGNGGFGRQWSPMVEFLADREFEDGARTNWDIVPQFQVTLSARQHIRANFGVRFPANNREGRSTAIVFHLLWDTFDGGLRDGW